MVTDKIVPSLVSPNRGLLAYHPRRYVRGTCDLFGQTVWHCPCCGKLVPMELLGRFEDRGNRAMVAYRVRPFVLPKAIRALWDDHLGDGTMWRGEKE